MKKRIEINLDDFPWPSSGDPRRDAMFQMFMEGVKAGMNAVQNKPAGRPKGSAKLLEYEEGLRRYVLIERRIMRGMKKTAAAKDLAKKDPRAWRTIVRHYDGASKRLRDSGLMRRVDWCLLLERWQSVGIPKPPFESLPPEWQAVAALDRFALPQDPPRHVAK